MSEPSRPTVHPLAGDRVFLDEVREDDVEAIARYCTEPVFERFMTTPWPYERRHAEHFVREDAPNGWRSGREPAWAVRRRPGGPLCGTIGIRMGASPPRLGYWLGAEHRGHGLMTDAVRLVAAYAKELGAAEIGWECLRGNRASAAVARRAGFRFLGEGPGRARPGVEAIAWRGVLDGRAEADPAAAAASWAPLGL